MPWHLNTPNADPVCIPSRMLRGIAASVLPLLITARSYAASSRFAPISTYPSAGMAQYTATADVNGDGKHVLMGNGNGSFQPAKIIAFLAAGSYPILTADFNRDGKPDLAVLVPGKTQVRIYLGRGDGTFASSKLNYTLSQHAQRIVSRAGLVQAWREPAIHCRAGSQSRWQDRSDLCEPRQQRCQHPAR